MANDLIAGLTRALRVGREKALTQVDPGSGGWYRILESFAGAWQKNVTVDYNTVLSHHADFACKTLIASDIAKLRVKLVQRGKNGVWQETDNYSGKYKVLIKPNHFQTRIQFFETWVTSKLQRGNTYVLKQYNGVDVAALYVLDPQRVRTLVATNGDVFYELQTDNLSGLPAQVTVPARFMMHDRFNCMFHPLVGVAPLFASGLSSTQGIAIQEQATNFFQNGSRPGGILSAPGEISPETAQRLKESWQENFTGANAGKVAVLGDGLKYEGLSTKATDAQLIEQLKWTADVVCSVYHVPPYKIGIGQMPSYNNIQALNVEYYSQCLQRHIEDIELLLDEGLDLRGEAGSGKSLGTEFDVDGLLRMDSVTQLDALDKAKSLMTLDERRRKMDLPPITGGGTVYLQQQDHSIEAIAARDAQLIEASKNPPQSQPPDDDAPEEPDDEPDEETDEELEKRMALFATKADEQIDGMLKIDCLERPAA